MRTFIPMIYALAAEIRADSAFISGCGMQTHTYIKAKGIPSWPARRRKMEETNFIKFDNGFVLLCAVVIVCRRACAKEKHAASPLIPQWIINIELLNPQIQLPVKNTS